MSATPTKRTLDLLRADGYLAEVVEKFNPHAGVRQDLFGFVDIIAIRDNDTVGVQCTTATNMASRIRKIADHTNTAAVRAAGWSIWVIGWRKNSSGRWEHRRVDVS